MNELIVLKIMNFGYSFTFQSLDKGLIEKIGPSGFTASIFASSSSFVSLYSGLLYHTVFVFLTFAILFISFFAIGSFTSFSTFSLSFLLLFLSYFLISFFSSFFKLT